MINLQADGSAMYTLQALWTQARERLDVTTVIFEPQIPDPAGGTGKCGRQSGAHGAGYAGSRQPDIDWPTLARDGRGGGAG